MRRVSCLLCYHALDRFGEPGLGAVKEGVAVGLGQPELAGGRGDDCLERILGVLGKPLTLSD